MNKKNDWKAIAISIWSSEDEEDKVIRDFGISALSTATLPDGLQKEKWREEDPEQIFWKKVELSSEDTFSNKHEDSEEGFYRN